MQGIRYNEKKVRNKGQGGTTLKFMTGGMKASRFFIHERKSLQNWIISSFGVSWSTLSFIRIENNISNED